MKKMKTIMVILVMLISNISLAQKYYFKVLASKGENTATNSNSIRPIKIGSELNKDDLLEISTNGYIGLMHNNGQTWETNTSVSIPINELYTTVGQKKGIISKYSEFVYSRIENVKDKNPLVVTGGVERTTDGKIKVNLPHKSNYTKDQLTLTWDDHLNLEDYHIKITDRFGKILIDKSSSKPFYSIDIKKSYKGKLLVIQISIDNLVSDEFGIQILSADEKSKIESEQQQLETSLTPNSSLSHLMLASFYEINGLIIDANEHYQKAIELSSDVDDFKLIYSEFKSRNEY